MSGGPPPRKKKRAAEDSWQDCEAAASSPDRVRSTAAHEAHMGNWDHVDQWRPSILDSLTQQAVTSGDII